MNPEFQLHTEQNGSFELAITAEEAFPLFSPEGERRWLAGWNPQPVFPVSTSVVWQENSVFTLERHGERLTWWIVDVDRKLHRVSYVYFATNRAVRVNVTVEDIDKARCRVAVTYVITATDEGGEPHVAEMKDMDGKMKTWKELIDAALSRELAKTKA